MAWKVEQQSNGRYAIFSTRLQDYIVIDADEEEILRVYSEKGIKVYVASAKAQMEKRVAVSPEGERKIEDARQRGVKKEPPEPIGATGFTLNDD